MTESTINKKIRHARITAMISGIITLAASVTLIHKQNVLNFSLFNMLSLVDVCLIFGLAYGIHKKSRLCAVLMFEYFLLSKVFTISMSSHVTTASLLTGTVFLYFLFQGVTGTFAYHKCNACGEQKTDAVPAVWICAGSCGLILYVLILPAMLI